MSWPLRESTAGQEIPLGPFIDSGDGNTAETGLTIANTDIKLQKNGATTQANKNSGGATHIATGDYYAVLDATDTNTLGPMRVKVHVSGALPVWLDCVVYPAVVYDALFLGTDRLEVNTVEMDSALQPASAASIADAVWDEALAGHAAAGSTGEALAAAANVDTEVAAIKLVTDKLNDMLVADSDSPVRWQFAAEALINWQLNYVEGSYTWQDSARGWNSALLGKASGMGTTTAVLRDLDDSKDRITAVVDSSGNRTSVTLDLA
jgi:hypothetical protein